MAGAIATSISLFSPIAAKIKGKDYSSSPSFGIYQINPTSTLPILTSNHRFRAPIPKASVGSANFVLEPSTNVKFQTLLSVPGCLDPLVLLGTGYREKVFAIIGVKVYAAGLYVNNSIIENLNAWKRKSAAEIEKDSALFSAVYEASSEKSLQIVLVRDVDGKTFWDALDDAISPRIKAPTPVDESALSTFRSTFQGRPLKQGTLIFLTWVEPSKMLISISSDGMPSTVDATIDSTNVSSALFNVFFGDAPVSPLLKTSVANGLAMLIK
ncbi:fatty-acid-binding protein 3, chloroplastic [Magnolia sinica]|uniref:fatty-acid-binding protein 3, chloroplastic n=1 Tax=Magnolia sinica TaxID=86752 RepID=UPI0026587B92|nr:fatty-acid-binding protein 3, chloroplastic [Magnolia sinica]